MPNVIVAGVARCWLRSRRRSARCLAAGVAGLRVGQTRVVVPLEWFVAAPLLLWLIATRYVPLLGPSLGAAAAWSVALLSLVLIGAALLGQVVAHLWVAWLLRQPCPSRVRLAAFGDVATAWPRAARARHTVLIAAAGPAWHLLVAGGAWLLWMLRLHPIVDLSAILLALVNLALGLLNLAPGYPLDGGRLTCAIVAAVLNAPHGGVPLAMLLGWGQVVGLLGWGWQFRRLQVPLSAGCGWALWGLGGLLAWALLRDPPLWRRGPGLVLPRVGIGRWALALGLILSLLGSAGMLLPLPYGLRMPGAATPIAPMVALSAAERYPSRGEWLLTTVVEQTPIVAGQWVYAQLDPVVELVAPERILPSDVSPQRQLRHSYRLLLRSEEVARQVALEQAGLAGTDVLVELRPFNIIGGSSAGLMFALATYDLLTPRDLTRGWQIAGTGTLDATGRVGPVVGVKQKVAAAEAAQADYFLVPLEHYAEAVAVARRLQVVPVTSFAEALALLRQLPANVDS